MAVNKDEFYSKYVEEISSTYSMNPSRIPCFDYEDFVTLTTGLSFDSEMSGLYSPYVGSEIGYQHTFQGDSFIIRDEDKSIHFGRGYTDCFNNRNPGGFSMYQKTDDGFYSFGFGSYSITGDGRIQINNGDRCNIQYIPNYRLMAEAEKYGLSLDEIKDKMLLGIGYSLVFDRVDFKDVDLKKDDMFMFFNLVYRNGIPHYYKKGKLEFTDEDRLAFEEEMKLAKTPLAEKNMEDMSLDERRIYLNDLVDAGVELSEEQENSLVLLNKLNEFRLKADERNKRQQLVRDSVVLENDRKENWNNDPLNPSNIHKNELAGMLDESNRHDKLLMAVEETKLHDFITDEQREELEKSREFSKMMQEAERTNNDQGMSSEVRSWYQEHYGSMEHSGMGK